MPDFFTRNRILVGQLLLCFYMLAAVQGPALELLHFISHSLIHHQHSGMHSYADHINTHEHFIIVAVDIGGQDDQEHQHLIEIPVDKIEYLNQVKIALNILIETSSKIIDRTQQLTGIEPEIPSPPPEYIG